MTALPVSTEENPQDTLPALIERAMYALNSARSSAEVLEARDIARFAYDAAKSTGRIAKAKRAHDEVIGAVHRAQANALLIEARAKMRLADEYDAAQDRGDVQSHGGNKSKVGDHNLAPSAADIGLRKDEIHEARKLRDAEAANPGKAARILEEMVESGEEPTKAKLRREMVGEQEGDDIASNIVADPQRRALKKLTVDALIDEVIGLRADLSEAKALAAKLKTERDALKAANAELSEQDSSGVIRTLQAKLKNSENAKWRESEKTAAALRQVYALKKELKALGRSEIVLD